METSMQDSAEGYGEEYEGECGADDVSLWFWFFLFCLTTHLIVLLLLLLFIFPVLLHHLRLVVKVILHRKHHGNLVNQYAASTYTTTSMYSGKHYTYYMRYDRISIRVILQTSCFAWFSTSSSARRNACSTTLHRKRVIKITVRLHITVNYTMRIFLERDGLDKSGKQIKDRNTH